MEVLHCSICNGTGLLYRSHKTGKLRCEPCCQKARYYNPANRKLCGVCDTVKQGCYRDRFSGKFICRSCYRKDPLKYENCSVCGEPDIVVARDKLGRPICPSCRRKDPATYEHCSLCGLPKPVRIRNKLGEAICQNCYQRSKVGKCVECGKKKVIQALKLCYGCYQGRRRKRQKIKLVA